MDGVKIHSLVIDSVLLASFESPDYFVYLIVQRQSPERTLLLAEQLLPYTCSPNVAAESGSESPRLAIASPEPNLDLMRKPVKGLKNKNRRLACARLSKV